VVRVLVTGDCAQTLIDASDRLSSAGHEIVATAWSPGEAAQLAKRLRPDVILLCSVPSSEVDIADAARAIYRECGIPVVLPMADPETDFISTIEELTPTTSVVNQCDCDAMVTTMENAAAASAERDGQMDAKCMQHLLDATEDMISMHDPDGRVLHYSGPSRFDVDPNTLSGRMLTEFLGWKAEPSVEEQIRQVAASGEEAVFEDSLVFDGDVLDYSVALVPVREEPGRVTAVSRVASNVTGRTQAEAQLAEEKDRARKYLDIARVILMTLSPTGEVTLINREALRILSCSEEDVVGRSFVDDFIPEQAQGKLVALMASSGRTPPVTEEPQVIPIISGDEERIVEWRSVGLSNADGTPAGTLLAGTDITDRVRAEQEKERIRGQLVRSRKLEAIGRLAGGVAHDFNNLLTAIGGNAEAGLEKTTPGDPGHDELARVLQITRSAADRTRQLLLLSRDQPAALMPMDLNRDLGGFIEMLSRTIGESVDVTVRSDPDLWAVNADHSNIEQLLMNLVMNSKDAMPEGGSIVITIENVTLSKSDIREMPEGRPGWFVRLTVTDTGPGMTPDVMECLFEPFFTTKGECGRTGLGLSIVHGIVKQHRGWMTAASEPGRGTEFQMYFPTPSQMPVEEPVPVCAGLGARGNGEKILLVEDDEVIRELFSRTLSNYGYEVVSAGNASEAASLFEGGGGGFDLLLSDVVLPDGTGPELARRLTERQPDLHVLVTTGYAGEAVQAGRDAGTSYPCLRKPYSISTLLLAIREAVTH
jgi:PAS domain S-box-containing protein